ncbi:MAG TPA: prepilin-type N-terminal cleavage/methylation domain-containing protein [Clostridia bacterium]|nr:prepilin-type N-terminal cleavage/methylation domain-containing protein [Clostridia bacterium]
MKVTFQHRPGCSSASGGKGELGASGNSRPHLRGKAPRHSRRAARGNGFTLVEILIALGILSLVLAAIYSSWTAILRASKVGLDAAAAVQRARMASRVIEEALSSVQSFAANKPYYSFVAENSSDPFLEFTTRLSPSFPRSGKFPGFDVRRVRFYLKQGADGGRQLVLSQAPLLMEMDKDEQNFPLVLAKNVAEFKTEFWDLKLQDWVDEWKLTNQIPTLVKVTLKTASNAKTPSRAYEQAVRIVSIPSVTVQPGWQVPRIQAVSTNQLIR